jgi:hypothetical protein
VHWTRLRLAPIVNQSTNLLLAQCVALSSRRASNANRSAARPQRSQMGDFLDHMYERIEEWQLLLEGAQSLEEADYINQQIRTIEEAIDQFLKEIE